MPPAGRTCFFGLLVVAIVYIILCGVGLKITKGGTYAESLENSEWVASGRYWLDRQICNWLGLCGTLHLNSNSWTWERTRNDAPHKLPDFSEFWTSGEEDPDSWSEEERQRREIPEYVFEHAPYVHLFSGEQFWPSDIAEHLVHVSPHLNYTLIPGMKDDRNLTNLHELDDIEEGRHGKFVYLQSDDNVEEHPSWLTSERGIPIGPDPKPELDASWPNVEEDLKDFDLESAKQQALVDYEQASIAKESHPAEPIEFTPSVDGRCGGNSGFTCEGSRFGQCCSIYGWCGRTDEYCEDYCDPLHGKCTDLLDPLRFPKPDLRKRQHKRDFTTAKTTAAKSVKSSVGRSSAPAVLVTVDKGNGTLDAFWFFFYSFNLGQKVFNIRFGNHVGDWEHTLVRFKHGEPELVFFSEHNFGDAYAWHAVEKYLPNPDGSGTMLGTFSNTTVGKVAKRPVVYSAVGSHAMYATPGLHPYVLPFGLLHDQTDRGPLWDPAQNVQSYTYDLQNKTVRASTRNPTSPVGWFNYAGHWGDKYYKLSDTRQYRFGGQYHYVNGPTGPRWKNLGRTKVCQGYHGPCNIKHWLGDNRPTRLPKDDDEDGEEGGLPGGNYTDGAL